MARIAPTNCHQPIIRENPGRGLVEIPKKYEDNCK
jgi:hypothetical protein